MSDSVDGLDTKGVIDTLNSILELELAGVVRYTHYSFMVFGHARIPIQGWMRAQADESMLHAVAAGEQVTTLGGHPSLRIGPLLETHQHAMDDILREALEHERQSITRYRELLGLVAGKSIQLEEYARGMVVEEEQHSAEIEKMIRQPGSLDGAA